MFEEKKHWQLSNPFRILSGKRDPRPKSKAGHSRNRVSSVYLSDSTSASGFTVVPEFDGSAQAHSTQSGHSTYPLMLPVVTSSNPLLPTGIDGCLCDLESMGFHYSSCHEGGSGNISIPNAGWDDDFLRRLGSAYQHIRSMPCVMPPRSPLSLDPQMLRKQLGVPQHSVLNYPIHSSLDLPNPHVFPHEPTAPNVPPTRSPEVAHATTLKKLGLCMDTDVYPVPRRHGLPRKKSMAAVPVSENSFSQRSVLETPRSVRTISTPEPRFLATYSPISAKSHDTGPITPSSSLPSSSRPASKGVLRKRNPDTPPYVNSHKRQISLPHIRPPSPMKVDIPLHHAWHERRTDFGSFSGRNIKQVSLHETRSRRLSGSTDLLASLAWTGTSSMISSSDTTNKKHPFRDPACLPDRLSMAIAMEDDSISDDALVARLEDVRRMSGSFDCVRDASHQGSSGDAHLSGSRSDPSEYLHDVSPSCTSAPSALAKFCDVLLPSPPVIPDTISHSEDAEVWRTARKALLCVREIARTERKYQEALKVLLKAQTATPPPPSMDPYISALVQVSETLLRCFLDDLSAWGVSTAFVTSEDELEAAMVSWCAVAGALFIDENDSRSNGLIGRWWHRKAGVISSPSQTKSTSTSSSPRVPSMLPIIGTTSMTEEQDEEYGAWQCPQIGNEKRPTFTSLQKSGHTENTDSRALTGRPLDRKPSVRELAIQPVQRVMRYVLLYRDLQDCTPPMSPSRILTERALEAAMRIAKHCDKAQRNPAFFRAS